jgi:hypothetical protein
MERAYFISTIKIGQAFYKYTFEGFQRTSFCPLIDGSLRIYSRNDLQLMILFPFYLGTFEVFGEYSLAEQEIMQRFLLAQEGGT